jgi:serine/threonine-protein kinase
VTAEQLDRLLGPKDARAAPAAGGELPAEVAAAAGDPANIFGKYVRVSKLGEGGIGEVWKAWDRDLRRWVAVKVLKYEAASELARFQREAQMVAKLTHPNIAAIYDVGEHAGRAYIAMQLIPGKNLSVFPSGDIRLLAYLVRDAAFAVHHAHEAGVIHRDLKPSNLMIEGDPGATPTSRTPSGRSRGPSVRVYVLDFGLAKEVHFDSKLSVSGLVGGTPPYMSPEQARGEKEKVGPPSDVTRWGRRCTNS